MSLVYSSVRCWANPGVFPGVKPCPLLLGAISHLVEPSSTPVRVSRGEGFCAEPAQACPALLCGARVGGTRMFKTPSGDEFRHQLVDFLESFTE